MDYFYRYETEDGEVYIGRDTVGRYKRAKDHLHSALHCAFPETFTENVFVENRAKKQIPYLKVNQSPQVMEMAWGKILKRKKDLINSLKTDLNDTTDEMYQNIKFSVMKTNKKNKLYRNVFDEYLMDKKQKNKYKKNSTYSNLITNFSKSSGLRSYVSLSLDEIMSQLNSVFKITSNITDKYSKVSNIEDEKIPIWTYFHYMKKHGADINKSLTYPSGCIEFLLTWVEFQPGDKEIPKILNAKIADISSEKIITKVEYENTGKQRGSKVAPPKEVLEYFLGKIGNHYNVDKSKIEQDYTKSFKQLKKEGVDLKRIVVTKKKENIYSIDTTVEMQILYRFFENLVNAKSKIDKMWLGKNNIKEMFEDVWPSIKFDTKIAKQAMHKPGKWTNVEDMKIFKFKKNLKQQ